MHQEVANSKVGLLTSYLDIHFHFNGGVAYLDLLSQDESLHGLRNLFSLQLLSHYII